MFDKDVKNLIISMVLVLVLITAFATVAYAENYMDHNVEYDMDGKIDLEKQSGYEYGTGARMRQVITGEGSMEKESSIFMEEGYIEVNDQQDWVTDEQALRNLKVTNSIKLSSPPAFVYGEDDEAVWWEEVREAFRPVTLTDDSLPFNSARKRADQWDALTNQIWAVSVEANPGHSGRVDADFEAAYISEAAFNEIFLNTEDYFEIEQHAATSEGILRRYIDISSPKSLAFLHEDMSVDGTSSVSEEFSLFNSTGENELFWHQLF